MDGLTGPLGALTHRIKLNFEITSAEHAIVPILHITTMMVVAREVSNVRYYELTHSATIPGGLHKTS